jgi:hypothetical protein
MGIGLNILANAAAGAVEGAGEGGAAEGKLGIAAYNAQNHERIKQELEGERERQNAVLANKNKLEQQATEPRIIPAGGTLQRPGEPDYTAPIKNPPEQRAEFEARANYYNSLSESVRRGDRARNQKPTLPKIIVKDDGMGNQFLFDENSGAVGTIVHGAPAQEGKSHWFSADEPARPAQPNDVIWRGPAGDVLHNGLLHFYPEQSRFEWDYAHSNLKDTPALLERAKELLGLAKKSGQVAVNDTRRFLGIFNSSPKLKSL